MRLINSLKHTWIRLHNHKNTLTHTRLLWSYLGTLHSYLHFLETYPNHYLPKPHLYLTTDPKISWEHCFCPQLYKSPINWAWVWYLSPDVAYDRHTHTRMLIHTAWCLRRACAPLQCENRFHLGALKYLLTQKNIIHHFLSHLTGNSIHELHCVW